MFITCNAEIEVQLLLNFMKNRLNERFIMPGLKSGNLAQLKDVLLIEPSGQTEFLIIVNSKYHDNNDVIINNHLHAT